MTIVNQGRGPQPTRSEEIVVGGSNGRKIRRRPSGICQRCNTWVEALRQDHIIPLAEGGLHDTSNLQWLCDSCDQLKTNEDLRRMFTGRKLSPEHVEKLRAGWRNQHTKEVVPNGE